MAVRWFTLLDCVDLLSLGFVGAIFTYSCSMETSPESKAKEGKEKKSSPKQQPLPCLVETKDLLISKALAYAEVDPSLLEADHLDVMAWATSGSQRVRVGSSFLEVQSLTFGFVGHLHRFCYEEERYDDMFRV